MEDKTSMYSGNREKSLHAISEHIRSLREKSESPKFGNDHPDLLQQIVGIFDKPYAPSIDVNLVCAAAESGSARGALAASGLRLNEHMSTFVTPLSCAVKAGDPDLVCGLIALGADPGFRVHGVPPLVLAASAGHQKIARALLAAGANPAVAATAGKYRTALHAAAACDDSTMVSDFLAMGADADLKGFEDETPLLIACRHGSLDIVKALCAAGADVNLLSQRLDHTPLMAAAERGKLGIVQELLRSGADMNTRSRCHRMTAFLLAASAGRDDVVQLFLDRGANPDSRNVFDRTALMLAAESGSVAAVRKLLSRGAKVNPVCDLKQSALAYAAKAKSNSLGVVRVLLRHGAHPDGRVKDVLPDDPELGSDRWRDMDGFYTHTPLMFAAGRGDPRVVQELLRAGALAEKSPRGHKSENTALLYGCKSGNRRVVSLLCAAGADIAVVAMDSGGTALSAAVCGGNIDVLRDLLARGAPRDVVPEYGNSALVEAVYAKRMDMVQLLVSKGVDLSQPAGTTALSIFAGKGDVDAIKFLLKRGANVFACGENRDLPLNSAAANGRQRALALLLLKHAPVNATGRGGDTALMEAVAAGHRHCVDKLLKAGADVNLQNKEGWTPLMRALHRCDTSIARRLVEAGASFRRTAKGCPLHFAVQQPSFLRSALKRKLDINMTDGEGKTALMLAAAGHKDSCAISTRLLVDAGADVNLVSAEGKTALAYAAENKNASASFSLLLDSGSDLSSCGTAALEVACAAKHLVAVEALLDRGVAPSPRCMSNAMTGSISFHNPEYDSNCVRIIKRLRSAGVPWDGPGTLPISVHLALAASGDPFPLDESNQSTFPILNALHFATRDDTDLQLDHSRWPSSVRELLENNLACVRYAGLRSGHNRQSVHDGARDGELSLQCAVHAHDIFTAEAVIARLVNERTLQRPLARLAGRADLWKDITSNSVVHIA